MLEGVLSEGETEGAEDGVLETYWGLCDFRGPTVDGSGLADVNVVLRQEIVDRRDDAEVELPDAERHRETGVGGDGETVC